MKILATGARWGGYNGADDDGLAGNVARLLDLGVIGINFEDRVVKGSGLYDISRQAARIATVRETAEKGGGELFINAGTDLMLLLLLLNVPIDDDWGHEEARQGGSHRDRLIVLAQHSIGLYDSQTFLQFSRCRFLRDRP